MRRRGFLQAAAGLFAAALYGASRGVKQWAITRVDRESRTITFSEINAELKRVYPKDTFLKAVEKTSAFYRGKQWS